jgi:hypothetical protein
MSIHFFGTHKFHFSLASLPAGGGAAIDKRNDL